MREMQQVQHLLTMQLHKVIISNGQSSNLLPTRKTQYLLTFAFDRHHQLFSHRNQK